MSRKAFERHIVAMFRLLNARCMFRLLVIGCMADWGRFSPSAAESPLHHLNVGISPTLLSSNTFFRLFGLNRVVACHLCVFEGLLYAL